ncbi:CheY-like superfamily [Penicillium angulare]|uniref:CheY-like superfamily n=1 Tax=Penicillium angulare TaxID=116970 RepID=UPI002540F6B7|nr:CheY-like superfamily [Penicillium angulare]KAJ5288672.1 CheY-like superfamily [Penicillium angulare]
MDIKYANQKTQHHADRRVRELYRYYQPTCPLGAIPSWLSAGGAPSSNLAGSLPTGTPPVADVSDATSSNGSSRPATAFGPEALVLGSSNNTLTSFAQLAALRLNVERAFICVLDRDKQHVIAEATRSLNLNDASLHDNKDGIWLGAADSRDSWNVCKDTTALPPSDRQNAQYQHLVVEDMSEDERYRSLPFVAGEPGFKFYAGTPLTTDKNINLGCFFVLDKKPRGLTTLEKDTLGSLSMLVMDYMKICRQATEGRRAARLSRGLSFFVEGSSSFVSTVGTSTTRADSAGPTSMTPPSSNNRRSMFGDSSRSREGNSAENCSQNGSQDNASNVASQSPPNDRSLSNEARSFSSGASESKLDIGTSGAGTSRAGSSLPDWITNSSRNMLPPDDSQGNSWCFRRAANLLRESLDLSSDGGVAFFEANNTPFLDVDSGSDCSSDGSGPASILSLSTNEVPFSFGQAHSTTPVANLDRSFLAVLLRRYPKGKLWSFHQDRFLSISDDDDQTPRDRASPGPSRSPSDNNQLPQVSKPVAKRRRAAENTWLNQYFPNATQIMFVPLWNAVNSQWFSGCFCWTTDETQVFTSAVELSSVLGFGTSVMAEYSRIESLIADRQKGDFIGSISHELRSPLHGILAAAEFLNSTQLNEFQDSLLETVNACGRTLLDTMNQVLDFSKVVSLERTWKSMKRSKESPLDLKGTDKLASHLDTYVATDLSILAEEVVEGICLGHAYGRKSSAAADMPVVMSSNSAKAPIPSSNVDVIIDMAHNDWVYRTQPGALRRIIMNLFGNAMKYTDQGRVTLSLEASSHSEGRSRRQGLEDIVTLTVADTGRGISEEFLRGKLYTPFAQEDSLAVGTGLGLSIVRSLVKALNGHIRVRSRPGEGTIVRVSLPLARPVGEESPAIEQHAYNMQHKEILMQTLFLREGYPDKKIAFWGTDPSNLTDPWIEIARFMTDWFDLEIAPWPPTFAIDILVVQESDLPELRQSMLAALPALLILCDRSIDYTLARSEWLPLSSSVDIIRRPCGPHKLARSVLKCLQHGQSAVVTPASVLQNPMEMPIRSYSNSMTAGSSAPTGAFSSLSEILSDATTENVSAGPQSTREISPGSPSVITASPRDIVAAPLPGPLAETAREPLRPSRVLVVDDNRINLNLMMTFMKKRRLTELGAAENGKLAVEAVEQMPTGYDIIFMDMSMPVMNGFEATRAIRSLERDHDGRTPAVIIALTGLSSSRDESEALASGVDMFLTKPVSFKEVSRLLDEWEKNGLKFERKSAV